MARFNAERIGRVSLRVDAIYCAILGAAIVVAAALIAKGITLPPLVIALTGVIVVGWAAAVIALLAHLRLRSALRIVMAVNVLAAVAIAFAAMLTTSALVSVAVLTIAVDVLLFAVSQGIALRGLQPDAAARPAG
ncbi:hypothetical protein Q9R19_08110 [Microbacterium sp. ARD32]|uniref:hypothetical protein n=1 Tax=Microbacterium sp. ARD32 TaxID=2962577 RepID=UPI0028828765|nr:hypothetical protein [Microbacterium sp. ARD32]MDT0157583.1 hypothetical protein [Microbacterium sp. ARD32]